ncbi:MAG: SDR family NAD(P)-dependent oxidoreductase [Thioalkalivibrionaceae bacterium]
MDDQSPRTVLITGHSSGLGRGLAEEAVARGARVLGMARRESAIAGVREGAVDLTDFSAVPGTLEQLLGAERELDLVILNAGRLGQIEPMVEASIDEIKAVFDINVWSGKAVLDALHRRGTPVRQVIAMSSGAAVLMSRGWNGYAMSKAALNALMRLYAQEWPQTHCCALAPGLIDTPMLAHLLHDVDVEAFPAIAELRKAAAAGRVQTPRAAAAAIFDALAWLRGRSSGSFVDLRERIDPDAYAAIVARAAK